MMNKETKERVEGYIKEISDNTSKKLGVHVLRAIIESNDFITTLGILFHLFSTSTMRASPEEVRAMVVIMVKDGILITSTDQTMLSEHELITASPEVIVMWYNALRIDVPEYRIRLAMAVLRQNGVSETFPCSEAKAIKALMELRATERVYLFSANEIMKHLGANANEAFTLARLVDNGVLEADRRVPIPIVNGYRFNRLFIALIMSLGEVLSFGEKSRPVDNDVLKGDGIDIAGGHEMVKALQSVRDKLPLFESLILVRGEKVNENELGYIEKMTREYVRQSAVIPNSTLILDLGTKEEPRRFAFNPEEATRFLAELDHHNLIPK